MSEPRRWLDDPENPERAQLLARSIPGEPPPGARERSWRRLSTSRRPRRSFSLWVPVTAVAVAVFAASAWQLARVNEGIAPEQHARSSQEIVTPPGAHATLRFGAFEVALGENSSAHVTSQSPLRIQLERGELTVRGDAGSAPAQVESGEAWVEGTSFTMRVAPDGSVSLMAHEAAATFTRGESRSVLPPGERWPPPPPEAAAPLPSPAPAAVARIEPRRRTVPQQPEPAPLPIVEPVVGGTVEEPVLDDAGRWAEASRLVAEGRPAEALGLLEALSSAEAPWAEMALYEAGRVQALLERHAGALESFATYRARFPTGTFRPEVDLGILEASIATGNVEDGLEAAEAFLAEHPTSERLLEVRLLRATLLRKARRLDDARRAYLELSTGSGASAAEALFLAAACAREQGDLKAAREGLEMYLVRHPNGPRRAQVLQALGRVEQRKE